jgi:murein DD-endopeptidase MepM/ murein hydrolase activator NlpD
MPASEAASPRLEIQIVPGDARRRGRSIRFTEAGYRAALAGLAGYVAFLAVGLGLAPFAWRKLASESQYGVSTLTGDRLEEHARVIGQRFRRTAEGAAELRSRLHKVHLAYGLESSEPATVEDSAAIDLTAAEETPTQTLARLARSLNARIEIVGRFLEEIETFEAGNQERVALTPAMSPLRSEIFVLTTPMGFATSPFTQEEEFHAGVDLAAPAGTPVYAPADGKVVFAGKYPLSRRSSWWRLGKIVALRSGDDFVTLFGHCEEITVRRGQTVSRGEQLATVGDSGWTPNSSLHFAVWRRDAEGFRPMDPRLYILDRRWEDDAELLAAARQDLPEGVFEKLPRALGGE